MTEKKCVSCKSKITNDTGSTTFKCPSCGNRDIIRCKNCRKIAAKYRCPECGFEGPN